MFEICIIIYLVPVFPQAYGSTFPPSPPAALLGTEPVTESFILKSNQLNNF